MVHIPLHTIVCDALFEQYGAYQEYTVAPASTTFPIPESVSFEDASTLPLAVMTAAIGLFVVLGIPEPPKPGEDPSSSPGADLNTFSSPSQKSLIEIH